MIRLGGPPNADGVGITSGLNRMNYDNGMNYQTKIDERVKEQLKKPEFGWQDLISEGYRTSRGATDWRDWVNQASDRALEIQDERKAKPGKDMATLLEAQAGKGEYFKKTRPLEIERRQMIGEKVRKQIAEYQSIEEIQQSGNLFQIDSDMVIASDGAWPGYFEVVELIQDEITEKNKNGPTDPGYVADTGAYMKKRLGEIINAYLYGGNAMGGRPRVARAYGNPNPSMTENIGMTEQIDTPQGDMSMTEDVSMTEQLPGQASQDPFVLLRARLPQEIPDDVVRLIAYNPDAFADFASIETQEDVTAFNQQYGVELVVNTDELA